MKEMKLTKYADDLGFELNDGTTIPYYTDKANNMWVDINQDENNPDFRLVNILEKKEDNFASLKDSLSNNWAINDFYHDEITVKIIPNERDVLKTVNELNKSLEIKGDMQMENENILAELSQIINGYANESELPLELQKQKVKEIDKKIFKFKEKHREMFAKKERKIHQVKGKIIGDGKDHSVRDQPNTVAKTFSFEDEKGHKDKAVIYLERENNFEMKKGMVFEMQGWWKSFENLRGENDWQFQVIDCKHSLELVNDNEYEIELENENKYELER